MTSEQKEKELDWRKRVFDSLSFPALVLQPDRVIISANEIFIKKIGLERNQVVGKTCWEVFSNHFYDHELPCSGEECPLEKTLKYQRSYSVLKKLTSRDGMTRWEDRAFSPIFDDDGNVAYIIESFRDVTRVKTLEKMYSGIQELLHKVIHSSASAIVAAERHGQVILVNEAAENLFGYTFNEARDINIENVYPPGVARDIMAKMRDEDIGEKGKLPVTKVNIVTKKGEEIPVEMTAAIILEEDKEMATMGIYNDLREKVAVEKQLQEAQAQLMQSEKLASLGRLAAGVAHEINNPLTSILLYGNLMKEKLEKEHPLAQNLDYVLEDAERCKEIVKDLLAYSRQASPSKQLFYVRDLVEESLGLIRDQKLFMNVHVVKELSVYQMKINADKNQLCQVLINLIINAVDAMNNQGTLTVRSFRDEKSDTAIVEVADTGSGIPDTDINKVFDPFFTTKELGKGTGLGLSMAYGIVKENRGRIYIKSTGPKGTVFRLELPEVQTSEPPAPDEIG